MRPRLTFVLAAGLVAALLLAPRWAGPSRADPPRKGDGEEVRRLRQTVQRLQGEAAERNQKIQQLQAQIQRMKNAHDPGDAKIRQLHQQLREKDDRIDKLAADLRKARGPDPKDRARDRELEDLRKRVKDLEAGERGRDVQTSMVLRLKKGSSEDEVK